MSKSDINILKRGLKRVAAATLTLLTFAIALAGFIATAFLTGYFAVFLFFAATAVMLFAISLLYAMGLTRSSHKERQGEVK